MESVDVYKDLGLLTASNLSWNQHVDKITAKANRVLGLVKRTCRDLKDIDIMNTLYCSLVRPLLEYSWEGIIHGVEPINYQRNQPLANKIIMHLQLELVSCWSCFEVWKSDVTSSTY